MVFFRPSSADSGSFSIPSSFLILALETMKLSVNLFNFSLINFNQIFENTLATILIGATGRLIILAFLPKVPYIISINLLVESD